MMRESIVTLLYLATVVASLKMNNRYLDNVDKMDYVDLTLFLMDAATALNINPQEANGCTIMSIG